MKGNPIINARIHHFKEKKQALLKMKKSERRGELKIVEETIIRLKRWNRELEAKKAGEAMEGAGRKMKEAAQKTVKACQEMSEAFAKLNDRRNVRGVNPMKYK